MAFGFFKKIVKAAGAPIHLAGKVVGKVGIKLPTPKVSMPPALSSVISKAQSIKSEFDSLGDANHPTVTANEIIQLVAVGKQVVGSNKILQAGLPTLKTPDDKTGFYAGLGMMQHTVTEAEVSHIQNLLTPTQRNGFNVALAVHLGLTEIKIDPNKSSAETFGIALAQGLAGAPGDVKAGAVLTVGNHADVKAGILHVASTSWFHKLLVKLHLAHDKAAPTMHGDMCAEAIMCEIDENLITDEAPHGPISFGDDTHFASESSLFRK